ncbi:MAG: hypothetical protein ACPG4F_08770 [Paracoccaceae bacterium]
MFLVAAALLPHSNSLASHHNGSLAAGFANMHAKEKCVVHLSKSSIEHNKIIRELQASLAAQSSEPDKQNLIWDYLRSFAESGREHLMCWMLEHVFFKPPENALQTATSSAAAGCHLDIMKWRFAPDALRPTQTIMIDPLFDIDHIQISVYNAAAGGHMDIKGLMYVTDEFKPIAKTMYDCFIVHPVPTTLLSCSGY